MAITTITISEEDLEQARIYREKKLQELKDKKIFYVDQGLSTIDEKLKTFSKDDQEQFKTLMKYNELVDAQTKLKNEPHFISPLLEHVLFFGELNEQNWLVEFSQETIKRTFTKHGDKDNSDTGRQAFLVNGFDKRSAGLPILGRCPFQGQSSQDFSSHLHKGTLRFFKPDGTIETNGMSNALDNLDQKTHKKEFIGRLEKSVQDIEKTAPEDATGRTSGSGLPDKIAHFGSKVAWEKVFDLYVCGEDEKGPYVDTRFLKLFFEEPFAADYIATEVIQKQRNADVEQAVKTVGCCG